MVTWNNENTIVNCVDSILEYESGSSIVVVDNCSTDSTIELLKDKFDGNITLIEQDSNVGFAEGNNRGLEYVHTEYVCFLNPDTVLIESISGDIVSYFCKNKSVGIVGPALLNPDGTMQPSVSTFERPFNTFIRNLGIGRFLPKRLKRKYTPFYYIYDTPCIVDWLMGAALYSRTMDIKAIDGFSKDYYMYTEDMDLCIKMSTLLGKHTVIFPDKKVIHIGGVSELQNMSYHKFRKMQENELVFIKKFYPELLNRYKLLKKISFRIRGLFVILFVHNDSRNGLLNNVKIAVDVLENSFL
nr:glycosyltransferase family 2 protein [Adlercreutzia sp. ZJ304]